MKTNIKLCIEVFFFNIQPCIQVNSLSAQVLYNKIAEIAEIDENTNVLDVYCGTGTIALSVAKVCLKIHNKYIERHTDLGFHFFRNANKCTASS